MKKLPLVSVIVPTKNSEKFLESCLKSISNQSYPEIEILVVDNNSSDDTTKITKRFTNHVYNKGSERSAQRNFGAKKSKGTYLLFIDSDMCLSKNVVKECISVYESAANKNKAAIIIPEISIGESFWAKCKALERSFYLGVDWIEAPRFYPKSIFKKFNGYDEKQTGTEDFDLPQRIKDKMGNSSILRVRSFIYHNEGDLSLSYTLKKKFYYVRTAKTYRSKRENKLFYRKQSSLVERYKLFLSKPQNLLKNPVVGVGMLFMKTTEFAAGGLGVILKK